MFRAVLLFCAALAQVSYAEERLTSTTPIAITRDAQNQPEVRLVAYQSDVAIRYRYVVPPLPFPPFSTWRKWLTEHAVSAHCVLEWRDENGAWWHGELRSLNNDKKLKRHRVGCGEFPGTAFNIYGIYVVPGRLSREALDDKGRPQIILLDRVIDVDYRRVEEEIRKYGLKDRLSGQPGTGGCGKENVGLGGPAYKPSQNSNTMVNYVLQRCGLKLPAPDRAIGWDTVPQFPYSSNADAVPLDCVPW